MKDTWVTVTKRSGLYQVAVTGRRWKMLERRDERRWMRWRVKWREVNVPWVIVYEVMTVLVQKSGYSVSSCVLCLTNENGLNLEGVQWGHSLGIQLVFGIRETILFTPFVSKLCSYHSTKKQNGNTWFSPFVHQDATPLLIVEDRVCPGAPYSNLTCSTSVDGP